MDLGLTGAAALVTGGTRGIGQAVARVLADEGCQVIATGSSTESVERAQSARAHDGIAYVSCDIADSDGAAALPALVAERLGRLDIVVNNAARLAYGETSSLEEWDTLYHTKLRGYALVIESSIDLLSPGTGSIVCVSGMAAFVPSATGPQSAAVNAGIIAMSRGYAVRAAKRGVRVNVITPGATDTDRFQARVADLAERLGDTEAALAQMTARIPFGRPVDPREIGILVAMLSSPALSSVTGANVLIDAGGTLSR